jgi:hypothetical protein
METISIAHAQLVMPPGRKPRAREFYANLLAIPQVPKPALLASRGRAWFEWERLKVHLGVQAEFRASRKAHVALLVRDLEVSIERKRQQDISIDDDPLPGFLRLYVADSVGNRIGLLQAGPEPR